LKLVFILIRQLLSSSDVRWSADYRIGLVDGRNMVLKAGVQTISYQANGKVSYVNPDPATIQLLRNLNRGAASAEWVENYVAFVGRSSQDAFEQRLRLLRGVAKTLLRMRRQGRNVSDYILNWNATVYVKVATKLRDSAFGWPVNKTEFVESVEPLLNG
jgi:hypothetical protein